MLKVLPRGKKLGHASTASSDGGKCGLPAASEKSPQHRKPDATERRLASQLRRRFLLAPADANAAMSSDEPALWGLPFRPPVVSILAVLPVP